jgi:hypothetical protein
VAGNKRFFTAGIKFFARPEPTLPFRRSCQS